MKELSIIIVNYNTGKLLKACVASVDYPCEVIVVDNASSDDSIKLLKANTYLSASQGYTLIANKENVGFAKAVNQGIRKSSGRYKLLLNPDTIVKPGAIKRLLEFAENTPDAGVVGAKLLNPDGSVQESVMHFPTIWRAIAEFWLGQKNAYSKYAPKTNKPLVVEAVVGAAFLITPQALKKVGLLDERYFMYFEDLDYCRRVKNVGLKVYWLPDAEIIHYHGVSGKSLATKETQWKRLIPSSKIYHGLAKHYLINFVLWVGQKF